MRDEVAWDARGVVFSINRSRPARLRVARIGEADDERVMRLGPKRGADHPGAV